MRLELSLGVVLALSLAACGGGGSSTVGKSTSSVALDVGILPSAVPQSVASVPTTAAAVTTVATQPVAAITTTPTVTTTIPAPPAPSVKCIAKGGTMTTTAGRHVVLRLPGFDGPVPTIIVMHGYTGTPAGIEKYSELTQLANANGVAVMYPEGTATSSGGFGWATDAGMFATSGVDDVAALGEMIDATVATGCVDPKRLVISGESNGAGMALVALCDGRLRGHFAAAVLVIPAVDNAVLNHCLDAGTLPIGLSVVAGKLDRTVGYADGRPPLLPAEEWFAKAASLVNSCDAQAPRRTAVDEFVERLVMGGCRACSVMFAVADGTHTWPGSSRGTGGLTPGTFDLNPRLVALALNPQQGCLA